MEEEKKTQTTTQQELVCACEEKINLLGIIQRCHGEMGAEKKRSRYCCSFSPGHESMHSLIFSMSKIYTKSCYSIPNAFGIRAMETRAGFSTEACLIGLLTQSFLYTPFLPIKIPNILLCGISWKTATYLAIKAFRRTARCEAASSTLSHAQGSTH